MLIIGNKSFGPEDFELTRLDHNQAPDKSAYWKIIFLIFQPKHTRIVLLQVDVPATWLPNLERKLNYNINFFCNPPPPNPVITLLNNNSYSSKQHIII